MLSLLILYVVTLVYVSITERYRNYAMLIGLQGAILFAIAIFRLHSINIFDLLFILIETLVFKAIIVPGMLYRIIRRTKINRVATFGQSQFNSLLGSILALVASAVVTWYIADEGTDRLFFGVALYALLSGMVMITTRKRIFSHLVGFLLIENGVFLFSIAMGVEMPFLINIAILLDILISVLMLGIFMSRIGDRMHVLDAEDLTELKD